MVINGNSSRASLSSSYKGRSSTTEFIQETGHIEIDFGLDSLFVQENVELTEETQVKIRDNVAKLVEFTRKAEMNTRATSRRLWSDSEESLPQKLIARLQKVQ